MRMVRALALSLVPLILGPATAAGQGWTLDLYGGRVSYDLASSTAGEHGVVLGARYRKSGSGWLYVSTGVPFGSDDSAWGGAGLGTRLTRGAGSVDLGFDLGARGYLYRDPTLASTGGGGVFDLRPLVALGDRLLRVEARSGWVRYESALAGTTVSRGVHDSDLSVRLALGGSVRLAGTLRHVRAEEDDYSFGEARVTAGAGRLTAWASAGAWTSDALPTTEWGAGASLRLDGAGRTVLGLAVRHDASDPVFWNAPRRRWSLGVSHSLGAGREPERAPDPAMEAVAPEASGGRVTIRIPATDSAGPPSVAGDFTGWKPVVMVGDGDHWTATFTLEPGVYRYAFRSSSGAWYVPESLPTRRADGMGGFVAVLVVRGGRSR